MLKSNNCSIGSKKLLAKLITLLPAMASSRGFLKKKKKDKRISVLFFFNPKEFPTAVFFYSFPPIIVIQMLKHI